jgi:hypothetical protein
MKKEQKEQSMRTWTKDAREKIEKMKWMSKIERGVDEKEINQDREK